MGSGIGFCCGMKSMMATPRAGHLSSSGKSLQIKLGILLLSVVSSVATESFAQKVKVGYDKATDFSKFSTYSWAEPWMPVSMPVLYSMVVARVDSELQSKGFTR